MPFQHNQLMTVLAHWLPDAERVIVDSVPPGFSGAVVVRVTAGSSPVSWALKAWPEGTDSSRIAGIHHHVSRASHLTNLLAPPLPRHRSSVARTPSQEVATFMRDLGRIWELAPWLPGQPLLVDADAEMIGVGASGLAQVHDSLAGVDGDFDSGPAIPRCVASRMKRLQQLDRDLPQFIDRPLDAAHLAGQFSARYAVGCEQLATSLREAQRVLQRCWPREFSQIRGQLQLLANDSSRIPQQWVLRDVHREHVLFENREICGVLDYDAADMDSPAADLARWVGSFSAADGLEEAVAGYRSVRALSEIEIELTRTLMAANDLGGLGNWLDWLVRQGRQFEAAPAKISERISHLIASVCRIC